MTQAGRLGLGIEFREALSHAVEAERMEQVESGMNEHGVILQWK